MPPIKSVIKVEIQQYFLPHKWFVSTKNFIPEVYFFCEFRKSEIMYGICLSKWSKNND